MKTSLNNLATSSVAKKTRQYQDFTNRGWSYLRKGLKVVHIYGQPWRIGRPSFTNSPVWGPHVPHQVIYGPDNKEYNLWGDDRLNSLVTDGYVDRDGNIVDESKVKIFILTHILDDKKMWQFDLNQLPIPGSKIKVVYNNGTLKNIIFSGSWEDITVKKYYRTYKEKGFDRKVSPVAYRHIPENSKLSKLW